MTAHTPAPPPRDGRPWRTHGPVCRGSGLREPPGEGHAAVALIDCDQCDPLPPPAETMRVVETEES
jgi:hypothetical protein